jgi:class 3 adenylate cyclase
MRLVDRFIEIQSWPTSRKSVLLSGLLLAGTVLNWLITHVTLANSPLVDTGLLDRIYAVGTFVFALSLIASRVAVWAKKEGRWIPYGTVMLFGIYGAGLLYSLGMWSTSFFAVVPIAGILMALYFGESVGWFTFLGSLILIAAIGTLQATGALPYAPALLDRNVDAHQTAGWIMGNVVPVLVAYVLGFVLSILVVAARNLQDVRLRDAQKLIRRYVPSQLADKIMAGGHGEAAKPERHNLTIFFSDVEGFTNASDELDPEQLAALLNEYLAEMSAIADRYGATINQFVGDGIMIFFGAPTKTNDKDHALRAVRMSLAMQARMAELLDLWFKRGFQRPFRIRIGINTGFASVGDFGSRGRMVYSAIGLQTNLAARIQAQCPAGKVLISHTTWALVHDDIPCTDRGEIQVKGIHYPIRIYEVAENTVP